MTRDAELWAEAQRAAAAAGVDLERAEDTARLVALARVPLALVDAGLLVEGARIAAATIDRRLAGERLVALARAELTAAQWESCVALGVREVVTVADGDDRLVRLLADAAGADCPTAGQSAGSVIGVMGGCGGAGASVLAAAIALAAGRSGRPAVLCDLDPWGAGADVLLGVEDTDGARWTDIDAGRGRLGADALHRSLPQVPGRDAPVAVLTDGPNGGERHDARLVGAVLDAVRRAGEIAVVDLPRVPAGGPTVPSVDLMVLVVPADVRGCSAASRLLPRFAALGALPELVVRGPSPGGIGARDVADLLGLPLLAAMRPEPGLDRLMDARGLLRARRRGPLGRTADAVLRRAVRRP